MKAFHPVVKRAIRNRRYYLHRRVRLFASISVKKHTIYVPFNIEPTERQRKYLAELTEKYQYAVQSEIPYPSKEM